MVTAMKLRNDAASTKTCLRRAGHGPVLEVRVREDTVQEEQHRSGKDKIVQASPGRTAEGINTLQSSFIYRQ
jgi:hypothetical protein